MKKLLIIFSITFLVVLSTNLNVRASTNDSDIVYKYGTDKPVTYYGTNVPVTIPKEYTYQKQEFRAVWVATIWNLDVPKHTSADAFKQKFTETLNLLESYNMNVLIFQVRPKNDAFYESELNPWSRFLTGVEGRSPGWDPLPWMIEETHKRGIEFHAWFNPYRVFVNELDKNNFAYKHPDYVLNLKEGEEIFNPGIPEVQQFIIDTVVEVAEKYDIDGVHFDDYFYPYSPLASSYDSKQFQLYNDQKLSLDDWRRENVNKVVRGVKEELTRINQAQNKAIQFGISPYGVWANSSSNSLGSNTNNIESYSLLYADSYKWVKQQWIDYIVPQTYFEFTTTSAQYADVVDWWARLVRGTNVNLYTGQSIYRYKESGWNTGPWADPKELGNQLLFNSKYPAVKGAVYFRLNYLRPQTPSNLIYAQNALKNEYYQYKVLPPENRNLNVNLVNAPQDLSIEIDQFNYKLSWKNDPEAKAYYVYRYEDEIVNSLTDISKVVGIVWPTEDDVITFVDEHADNNVNYQYFVTAFNKANIESQPSQITNLNLKNILNTQIANQEFNQYEKQLTEDFELIYETQTQLNTIHQTIESFNEKVTLFKNNLSTLQSDIDEINQLIERLENDLNKTPNKVKELKTNLNLLKTKKDELRTSIQTLQAQYLEISQLNETITPNITSLNTTYGQLPSIQQLNLEQLETYYEVLKNYSEIIYVEKNNLDESNQEIIELINTEVGESQVSEEKYNELKSIFEQRKQSLISFAGLKEQIDLYQGLSLIDEHQDEYNALDDQFETINSKIVELDINITPLKENTVWIYLIIIVPVTLTIAGLTTLLIKRRVKGGVS